MTRKVTTRVITTIMSLVMLMSVVPTPAFASIANWEENNVVYDSTTFGTNGYYNVISKKDYVLVPGAAVESEIVLNNSSGTRRQVIHVIEVDPSNPDVSIVPGYNNIDQDLSLEENWGHQELTEMAKYYENNLGYNIVGGMNTDLYYDTYAPRVLVYNGVDLSVKGKTSPTSSILYVFQDAEGNISCDVKAFNRADFDSYLSDGTLLHAVGVSFGMVVKDGALVNAKEERTSDPAARSMVGVKEDGTLVICMNDGRGANNSVGFCNYEEGEAMLALGCKWAANCDGGGSSTFLTKRVGEETFTMRSVPCDGAQRPTAHGIFVASNVAPTGELDVININSDYDYFAPNSEYTFGSEAIDTHGYAMDMPADVTWALSDDSFGIIDNGTFTSNGTSGDVEIQAISNGNVVGTKTITIADPDVFELSADSTVVPYSTADKPRTISIPIVAMIGESYVYYDTNAIQVTLSDENAGTLNGFNFTATDDTSISGVTITAEYLSNGTKLNYAVQFGKGSEVIFDFEDGDKAGFMGFEEAKQWSLDNGVYNTLVGDKPLAGQFNEYLSSDTFTTTAEEGGQVRNGNYALAWKLDNTDAAFASWSYNVLFNTNESIVLRDVENGKLATTLGMWLYIPENAFPAAGKGVAFQSQLYAKNADGTYSCKQDHFMFTSAATGLQTNLNSATNADIPESRWVYAKIDISKYDYLCTPVASDTGNTRSPSFVRTYVKPDTADVITFYIDDITLDYSSAVDDRVLPTVTAPTYSTSDTAISLNNGTVINGNQIAFSANVSDNLALDLTSGKISVDGVEVKSAISGGVLSSKEDITLVAGTHTVAFEVKDALGNPTKLTRTFTVAGDAVVELSGHNNSGAAPKAQSVYYVDINVADLTNVNKLVATLKLNNSNVWETEGAVVAEGFKADFAYNEVSELLTVTVEATDASKAKALDKTIVSIPVRVWTFDRYNYVTEKYDDPTKYVDNRPVVNVKCDVVYGEISLADKTTSPFGGAINVATELTTISSPYHVHDAELTVLNGDATCTQNGYANRTYCETCKSVVDWGTVIDATGHSYALDAEEYLSCECGNRISGNGLVNLGEDIYYLIADKALGGWQNIEGDVYCYADPTTKKVVTGVQTIKGLTYTFDENGAMVKGAWVKNATGIRYSYGPKYFTRTWKVIDGNKYYFGTDSYAYTGFRSIPVNRNNVNEGIYWYEFDENGVYIRDAVDLNGIVSEKNQLFYVVNGKNYYGGLMFIEGDYYYARTSGEIVTNRSYGITKTNDLLPKKIYTFGADGKMTNPPVVKNGIVEENGKLWWYVDDVKTYGGLLFIEGDYYYARTSGEIVVNRTYGITKTNDLLPKRNYTFGADGKLLNPPAADPEPVLKNGIIEEGGKLWWYVDDVKTYGGLLFIEGDYYYARTSGEIVTNRSYGITKTNDLLPKHNYTFGADGKLLNPPA